MPDVEIPSSPMLDMARIKVFGSQSTLNKLQAAINSIAGKARSGMPLNDDEADFLVELYESFHWGGRLSGYPEASALAEHYVHGNGAALRIDPEVYRTSVIVMDVQRVMKRQIQDDSTKGGKAGSITMSSDAQSLQKRPDFQALMEGRGRDVRRQGWVKFGGWLMTEQSNERLQKANNRFQLKSVSYSAGDAFVTTWRVDDVYEFETFKKEYNTELHIRDKMVLVLPDGLSEYMTRVGLAQKFVYFAEWQESWKPEDPARPAPAVIPAPRRPPPRPVHRKPRKKHRRHGHHHPQQQHAHHHGK